MAGGGHLEYIVRAADTKNHLSEYCSVTCPLQESKVKFWCAFNVYRSIGQIQDYQKNTIFQFTQEISYFAHSN